MILPFHLSISLVKIAGVFFFHDVWLADEVVVPGSSQNNLALRTTSTWQNQDVLNERTCHSTIMILTVVIQCHKKKFCYIHVRIALPASRVSHLKFTRAYCPGGISKMAAKKNGTLLLIRYCPYNAVAGKTWHHPSHDRSFGLTHTKSQNINQKRWTLVPWTF